MLGDEAVKVLGEHPNHNSKEFTNFQQSHYGQYVRNLLQIYLLVRLVFVSHMVFAHGYKKVVENRQFCIKSYSNFQAKPLLGFIGLLLIVPCGLHLILARHRYLWNYMFDLITDRKQEDKIPQALPHIGCHFLALQVESYFKRYF